MDLTDFLPLLKELGSLGLVCFIVWHTFTKTIPGIINRMTAENAAARSEFANSLNKQREDFTKSLQAQRSDHTDLIRKIVG